MKSTFVTVGAVLLAAVAAQPHRHQHQHLHERQHQKREIQVVWETEWVVVTETVALTTTIWVEADAPQTTIPAVRTQPAEFYETTSVFSATTPTAAYVAPPPPAPTTTSTSVYVAPPAPIATTPAEVAPTPSAAPVPEPVPTTQAPIVVAAPVVPTSAQAAPPVAATSAPSSGGSSGGSGPCSSGSPCSGDITFYEAGLGACGIVSDGEKENVIALPVGMMGAQSNGNPFCGKGVTISRGGKTVTATVVDKCMGCKGNSIDLSNKAFAALADFDLGRTQAEWWFNN